MSKKNKNANAKKGNKSAGIRIFAVLLLAVCVLAAVVIPYSVISKSATDGVSTDVLYSIVLGSRELDGTMATLYSVSIYVFAVGVVLAALFALIAIFSKNKARNLVRTSLIFLMIGALVYTVLFIVVYNHFNATAKFEFDAILSFGSVTIDLFSAVIALVALILFIIFSIRKREKKEEPDEVAEAENNGFHLEEYAEAYAYEGGPVAGVLMAQEVNPTFLPQQPHVNTAGYDFYNCKSFDPFIATLNDMERNAFTELFILKYSGTMPELPDYVVGGDNKEFFRKIFIYLGQYRDRIPQPLLTKMYQFSMKI
ncbi:MAG: hypothetical protein IJ284_01930 [Clostridia bacterium]|nr:hypothetical protein [Clostridia bacterium]